jgi:hypothetical protein
VIYPGFYNELTQYAAGLLPAFCAQAGLSRRSRAHGSIPLCMQFFIDLLRADLGLAAWQANYFCLGKACPV